MNIKVMVKTNSPNPRIEALGKKFSLLSDDCRATKEKNHECKNFSNNFLIYVSAEPEHNEANIEVIKMLSKYFGVPWKNIKIKAGLTNKNKLIEIL